MAQIIKLISFSLYIFMIYFISSQLSRCGNTTKTRLDKKKKIMNHFFSNVNFRSISPSSVHSSPFSFIQSFFFLSLKFLKTHEFLNIFQFALVSSLFSSFSNSLGQIFPPFLPRPFLGLPFHPFPSLCLYASFFCFNGLLCSCYAFIKKLIP